jgi:hypothetical protein
MVYEMFNVILRLAGQSSEPDSEYWKGYWDPDFDEIRRSDPVHEAK